MCRVDGFTLPSKNMESSKLPGEGLENLGLPGAPGQIRGCT